MKVQDTYQYYRAAPDWLQRYVRPQKQRAMSAYLWLRGRQASRRLTPSFLIIGIGKGGTTSLFSYLVRHPRIAEPLRKEIGYFSGHWDRPLEWYLAHFPRADRLPAGVITGEASPGYLFTPGAPERVAATLPDIRIIALLRNPIHRAISHYHHDVRRKLRQPVGLAETLAAEGMQLQPGLTARLIADMGWSGPPSLNGEPVPSYIRNGFYADPLARWLERFGRERILVMRSEDLFADPGAAYARTLDFLGLEFFDLGLMKAHNVGRYDKVDPRLARYLSQIYAEPNRRLAALLGDGFRWDG